MEWLCMKLHALRGINIVRGSPRSAQEYYKKSTKVVTKVAFPIKLLEKLESRISLESADLVIKVKLIEG